MYLYLLLNLGSFIVPFIYSFEKKRMHYIKYWKAVFGSICITATIFLTWDAFFTIQGVWGFNEKYHLSLEIIGMPIEEWLFFICIPYASIFIHYVFQHFYPEIRLPVGLTKAITFMFSSLAIVLVWIYFDRKYTVVNFSFLFVLLVYSIKRNIEFLRVFYITFIFILIPFFLVNGILTGSFIEEQVVWYNDSENMGIRLGTIPIEDIGYAFSMLYMSILLFEYFKKRKVY
ncbi:hypothetical protein KH5_22730 [Urechidicola sp. KH5]